MLSCRTPAAWPAGTTRGPVLAERANSVVWSGKRGAGPLLQVVVLDPQATAIERARFVDGALRLQACGRVDGLTHVVDVDKGGQWYACADPSAIELGRFDVLGWSLVERLEFVIAVLGALHTLHLRGLVHGALCLENLLVTADRCPILTEIGVVDVALLAGRDGARLDDYRPFAAPEVCRGDSFDSTADLYSAGRILEHLLVARVVDPGERRTIAFGAHGESAETLAAIVVRAIHEEQRARYPSAREMMRVLHYIVGDARRSSWERTPEAVPESTPLGATSAKASGDYERRLLVESGGLRLGCPTVLTGPFRIERGRRVGGVGAGHAARNRTPSAASAMRLVTLVFFVLAVITVWFVR